MSLLHFPALYSLKQDFLLLKMCNIICYFGFKSLEMVAIRRQLNQIVCKNNDSLQRAEKVTKVIFGRVGLSFNLTTLLRPLMG